MATAWMRQKIHSEACYQKKTVLRAEKMLREVRNLHHVKKHKLEDRELVEVLMGLGAPFIANLVHEPSQILDEDGVIALAAQVAQESFMTPRGQDLLKSNLISMGVHSDVGLGSVFLTQFGTAMSTQYACSMAESISYLTRTRAWEVIGPKISDILPVVYLAFPHDVEGGTTTTKAYGLTTDAWKTLVRQSAAARDYCLLEYDRQDDCPLVDTAYTTEPLPSVPFYGIGSDNHVWTQHKLYRGKERRAPTPEGVAFPKED